MTTSREPTAGFDSGRRRLLHDGIDLAQPDADPDEIDPVVTGSLGFVWSGDVDVPGLRR